MASARWREARDAVVVLALVARGLVVFHHHVGRGLVSIVLLALASAVSYGLAAVLQHRAAIPRAPGVVHAGRAPHPPGPPAQMAGRERA